FRKRRNLPCNKSLIAYHQLAPRPPRRHSARRNRRSPAPSQAASQSRCAQPRNKLPPAPLPRQHFAHSVLLCQEAYTNRIDYPQTMSVPPPPRLFVFDLDGPLIDSRI